MPARRPGVSGVVYGCAVRPFGVWIGIDIWCDDRLMSRPVGAYLFDQGWERERARLSGLSAGFDPVTIRLLEDLGVGPGWSCCEVGAGAGSIARWLAGRVAPHGRVMVTDLDTRFLSDLAELPGVEVRQADVMSDPFPPDAFDLIHARAVLEHLPGREQVIPALAAGLRPGGVLLVEDTVIGGDFGRATEPMVQPRRISEAFIRVLEAVGAGFRAVGADPRVRAAATRLVDRCGADPGRCCVCFAVGHRR